LPQHLVFKHFRFFKKVFYFFLNYTVKLNAVVVPVEAIPLSRGSPNWNPAHEVTKFKPIVFIKLFVNYNFQVNQKLSSVFVVQGNGSNNFQLDNEDVGVCLAKFN
jgi:hypothetical protein